ncbi:MAG: type II secretion system protein [Thermoguttaceae bacterium]|nr:type II secretion system protein [Thermoguttaceae bacterium]
MKRRDAFTLMEILIVLAILGFGMTLIVEMTTFAARNSERVEEDTVVQLACENLMNSILAGEAVAHVGVSTPIPDAPNWETSVELLDGPIEKLVAIRITAQRYVVEEVPSLADPTVPIATKVPDVGKFYVIKEWARRDEIKAVVVSPPESNQTAGGIAGGPLGGAADGLDALSGGSESMDAPYDPFASIDAALDSGPQAPQTNGGSPAGALGGGLLDGF